MNRPKTNDPCKNCGHPYVRHTKQASSSVLADWDRGYFGCRECDCPKFQPEEKP